MRGHAPRDARTSVADCHSWGSRADLGLKAAGKRSGTEVPNGRWQVLPSSPRARQPPARRWKRRRVMSSQGGRLACQWIRAPRPSLTARRATCTSGQAARPRARSFPMRSSRPAGPSALTTRQLPAWQHAANWRAVPILHLVGDSHARCSPAARHGLGIRHELGSDAASGRIGRH